MFVIEVLFMSITVAKDISCPMSGENIVSGVLQSSAF